MRRRSVVALAVAAVGVVLVALAPDAPPGAHRLGERIGDGAVPAPDARILARGVVERYEYRTAPEADLLVLEYCSHVPCGPAVLVLDSTADAMREGPWILVPVSDRDVRVTETPAPLAGYGPGGDALVTEMFDATYEARPVWSMAAVALVGVALAGAGLVAAAARPGAQLGLAACVIGAVAAGAWVSHEVDSWALLFVFLPVFVLGAVSTIATVGLLLFRRRWDWAFAGLVMAVAFYTALVGVEDYYGFWGAGD